VKYDIGSASYAKNNLSDLELALVFRFIIEQDYGIAHLKQQWAAMLLASTTGCRSGTFTAVQGYGKGASLRAHGSSYCLSGCTPFP